MKKYLGLFVPVLIAGCQPGKDTITVSDAFTVSGNEPAGCAYFTSDHHNNPVLCWTEGKEGREQLRFAVYNSRSEKFDEAVTVPSSAGTGFHPESANKVAFRKDGTIVAVYGRKHPTETNKYAGSVLYSQSFNGGHHWTREQYLHTDTLPIYSRSFFDLATLPDGEVGAVWLDGRLKLGKEGSSLFFARTKDRNGFQVDYQVGETVCECCRTDLFVEGDNIHAVYRDVRLTVEGQVRDFSYSSSSDNGLTFSLAQPVSDDHWLIDGCPHTGASIAGRNGQVMVAWFTAGGSPGVYVTRLTNGAGRFEPRQPLSAQARHPQLMVSGDRIAAVWDELREEQKMVGHHHEGHQHALSRVVFTLLDKDGVTVRSLPVPGTEGAEFPVLYSTGRALLIAYTQQDKVIFRRVEY